MAGPPSIFHRAVTENISRLEATTRSGIGVVLPEKDKIGRCLQEFVDEATQAQNEKGLIRINPLGNAGGIIDRYF